MLDKDKLIELLEEASEQSRLMFSMSGLPLAGDADDVAAFNIRYCLWLAGAIDKLPNFRHYGLDIAKPVDKM